MYKVNKNLPYIWVGTTIYKISDKPLISGDTVSILIPWNMETLKRDYSKREIDRIQKFDGFCCLPSHTQYRSIVSNFYNEYHELNYTPKEGCSNTTLAFLSHIFGNQLELGLDYLQILYLNPVQMLPVLCLTSRDRGTGKTSFLNWLKEIFGKNCTLNTNSDFRSQFNSDWASKILILVDEVLLDRKEDSERIKHLSTAKNFKSEAKGKDRVEIQFFGKFILCSNNELSFIYLDSEEIRFWVRKIPPFTGELKEKLNMLYPQLISEIPAFLAMLMNRQLSTTKQSRMWFTPEQIHTDALRKLKYSNRSKTEREIANLFSLIMEIEVIDEVSFTPFDLIKNLTQCNIKSDLTEIKRIIKDKWELKSQKNSNSYTRLILQYDETVASNGAKGRFYTIKKTFLAENFDDLMTNEVSE